jgi:hypothetical protein
VKPEENTLNASAMPTPARHCLRYWAKVAGINVILACVLAVVALAILEGYLRLTIPASSRDSIYEPTNSARLKVMKSDARIIAWGSELRTNKLGFRDDKSDVPAKRPSELRLIVLGDSFTVSGGVDYDRIYTSLLDKRLEESLPDPNVINLAVGGYNIIQYGLVLEEVGLTLAPDVVVVAVFPFNDLNNDTYRENEADAAGNSRPRHTPWYQKLYVHKALLVKVERRLGALLQRSVAPTPESARAAQAAQARREADAKENLEALERLVDSATARGLGVVVALLPNTDAFEQQRQNFSAFVNLCEARAWRCSNLLERFIATGVSPRSLRLNLIDGHPNEAYNALVAQFLAEDLLAMLRGDVPGGS